MPQSTPRRCCIHTLLCIATGIVFWGILFALFLIPLGIKSSAGDPLTQEILSTRSDVATRFIIRILWVHLAIGGLLGLLVSIPVSLVSKMDDRRRTTLRRAIAFHFMFLLVVAVYGTVTRPIIADGWLNVRGGVAAQIQSVLTSNLSPRGVLFAAIALTCLYILAHSQGRRRIVSPRGLISLGALGFVIGAIITVPRLLSPPKAKPDLLPNILFIGMDSLRADHLSCQGYPRKTTPNIDALAARGVRFSHVSTSLARTLPSWVSLMTSTYPHDHGIRDMFPNRDRRRLRVPTLATRLKAYDYTSFVVSDYAGESFALVDFGFDEVDVPPKTTLSLVVQREIFLAFPLIMPPLNNRIGHELTPVLRYLTMNPHPFILNQKVLPKIDAALEAGRPFFGTVFYSGPHNPYSSPYPGYKTFTSPDYQGLNKYGFSVRDPRRISEIENKLPQEDIDQIIALYDGATELTDRAIGELLASLNERGALDNTIIAFTSDHGEHLYENGNFVDHGKWFRGGDASTRVPFVMAGPGLPTDGRVIDESIRQLDLVPTIMALLDRPIDSAKIAGTDLTKLIQDPSLDLDLPIFSETGLWLASEVVFQEEPDALTYPSITEILKADEKDDTLILRPELYDLSVTAKHRLYEQGPYKLVYEPTKLGARYRLFDTVRDPNNQDDLSASRPDLLKQMQLELHAWLEKDPARRLDPSNHLVRDWTYFE